MALNVELLDEEIGRLLIKIVPLREKSHAATAAHLLASNEYNAASELLAKLRDLRDAYEAALKQ